MLNNHRDDCIILKSGHIYQIVNIIKTSPSDHFALIVRKYNYVCNFLDIPYCISSNFVGVYICGELSAEISSVNLDELQAKCYRMPYWENNYMVEDKFVVMTLLSHV